MFLWEIFEFIHIIRCILEVCPLFVAGLGRGTLNLLFGKGWKVFGKYLYVNTGCIKIPGIIKTRGVSKGCIMTIGWRTKYH